MDPRLYDAATKGDVLFLRYLAKNHPDLLRQMSGPNRNTVLHVAANLDNMSFVEEIRNYCPNIIEEKNSNDDTPLHIAARAGYPTVVQFLIDWARDEIHDPNVLLRECNKYGNIALHEAVRSRNPKVVELLMYADPQSMSILNNNGESPFYLAADRGLFHTILKMLFLILPLEQDSSHTPSIYGGPNGQTPMHAAVARGHKDMLQVLLYEKKELIRVADYDGRTPLHYAASLGNYLNGVIRILITDAFCAYQEDKDGLLPIHLAAIKGHNDIVECMLKVCPDLREVLNGEDQNVLHVAAKSGKQKVVKSILKMPELSMLINETYNKGNTPLHLATIHWHPKIVTTLVHDKRVDMNLINDEGLTALDIAEKYIKTLVSFRKLLTLAALRTANAPRALLPPVIKETSEPENSQPNKKGLTVKFYRDKINTLVLVAALITTVTFAAGFTMPGGLDNDGSPSQGMATMLTKVEFQIFLICNTIAMYSSIISAITLIWAQLGDMDLLIVALRMSLVLLGIALTMMAFAFSAGVYLVVSKLKWLACLVIVMSSIFLLCIWVLFVALQIFIWSKFPIMRTICYCVFRVLVHAVGQGMDE
ncbi:hypothetical protein HHK36_023669 [Tetracentron sinense]|uniref:PGG domain-containing protein n=1 Tax=Tetracentron sinense TaxID=13715 RepID=A0A834YQK3_TETSI|nr:hypothetical protein HHK36_023669 [Tetracentron sinense]